MTVSHAIFEVGSLNPLSEVDFERLSCFTLLEGAPSLAVWTGKLGLKGAADHPGEMIRR